MVSYVLSDKMLPKSYEEAIKQISSGTPTVIFFGAFYVGAFFFFQFSNRVHPCHLYHQITGNGFNACVWSKKNTKLDHWFWNLFDATQVRSGSF